MLNFLVSIVPIFLIILLGNLLRRGVIPSDEFWHYGDRLVYWVLLPSLLFQKIATSAFSLDLIGDYAAVILGAFACTFVFGLATFKVFRLSNPVASSVFQGCTRHNAYIAIAIAERVYGTEGLVLASLATGLLVPVTNMTMIPVLVALRGKAPGRNLLGSVLHDLARNPLIIAVLLGFVVNFAGFGKIPFVNEMTTILGSAALPVVLLCIGANIRVKDMHSAPMPLSLAIVGKMIVFPAAIVVFAHYIGLSDTATFVAVLFGAAPCSPASYALARQMDGDAPLMASILTVQTAVAIVTMPATVFLVERILG